MKIVSSRKVSLSVDGGKVMVKLSTINNDGVRIIVGRGSIGVE